MTRTRRFAALALGTTGCLLALAACGNASSKENTVTSSAETNGGVVAEIDGFIEKQAIDKSDDHWKLRLAKPPILDFEKGKTVFWNLRTNVGNLRLRLMPEIAPMHVSSTIYLTRLGFYDGVPFHRVIQGFMAQGGDPLGRGTGGPGYKYDGEFSRKVHHDKAGILSMANAGPGTDGSQFFITFKATPHLDGRHTIFGEVVEGTATLKELERLGSRSGTPTEPLSIEAATISVE